MKAHTATILMTATFLAIGAAYHAFKPEPPSDMPTESNSRQMQQVAEEQKPGKPTPAIRTVLLDSPEPSKEKTEPARNVAPPAQHRATLPPNTAMSNEQRAKQHWQRLTNAFNRQMDRLDTEQNPSMRKKLIQSIARYVRSDTLTAIEWAMGLPDPEERQLAMESINKYALTGIGARIAQDETGFPRIKETTVLSAAASTGMVEPGDYIVGMRSEVGEIISFEGMTAHEIVQHLRGKAGTDIALFIERTTEQGNDSTSFEVPVQRSLIVIQPSY